jgi:hydrogenase maturation protein HypF
MRPDDASETSQAIDIDIQGIVQGVGFRPFVYQSALLHGLRGTVSNTSDGVHIHIEGRKDAIRSFIDRLSGSHLPPLARINRLIETPAASAGHQTFRIVPSKEGLRRNTLISPDVCICDACLKELFDSRNRRYRYAFINCTHCGPRYTIIDDIPYDRPHTSMKGFQMCSRCQAEYDDPMDRRFHAQPNACPECGPKLSLHDANGQPILPCADPLLETISLLQAGAIVAIKGLGGFHLACDATNEASVQRLRKRKHREEKPLAVMAPDIATARGFARIETEDEALLCSRQRPIVLCEKAAGYFLAESVSSANRRIGVMLPYTPLHYLILREGFTALVMTSANMSEEPIVYENREAFTRLAGIVDAFLVHDRPIFIRADDSVLLRAGTTCMPVRRSRGYVPAPVSIPRSLPIVLACGAELKNTVCLVRGNEAFLSQHIGDLENLPTYESFRFSIDHLQRILDIEPVVVAHDLHPDYLSTRYALELPDSLKKIGVQHHHAHIAACMAENGLEGRIIGIACDGTGWGPDGTIWGCEILEADYTGFRRMASLEAIAMPGGAAAIREPWRMAESYLHAVYGQDGMRLPFSFLKDEQAAMLRTMIERDINCPKTSSLGRLFDGVAALLGLYQRVRFEGQAAMALEMAADPACDEPPYPMPIREKPQTDCLFLSFHPLIEAIVGDIVAGIPIKTIASKFHRTLVEGFTETAQRVRLRTGLDRVVLSGGAFQNVILSMQLPRRLAESGFQVFIHREVPCNDGGIALGQAVIAGYRCLEAEL